MMRQNWQTLLTRTHANAFRAVALSPQVTERFRCLVSLAITEGVASEKFRYLAEKEMKNG
ncbi:hypothetical protein ABWM31_005565 [Citrobacter koseri]|uniref:hypothetical protein n=1 Tax=Citrobacter koseri TaxID=545 RepID=UPI001BE19EA7|nr:hypothetical protein [Citrobacter koseri]MEB3109980.1 hypothetical protein [Citrobacter koseri]HBD3031437.1 hypothetical protein [Citrobacter koseri]HBD3038019.1 hypothetical protein [Citrobacter koseri]HBD3189770.1 hypothetical protein [Citrobacter koseri]HBD3275692.1 hypothetical protein [Citrobacter koseri]